MFDKEVLIEYHLEHNIFPPVPRGMWPFVKAAISLAQDGYWDHEVSVGNSVLTHAVTGQAILVREVIEAMHLEQMIDGEEM
jgi:hypothetical protein